MASSIYDWSLLAANNANADTDINWAEGQAPSTVNNSARFMMQRLKEFVADLGAIAAVGGSANVLTYTAKSAFSTYVDGIRIAFRASADNTTAVTLNVNSAGAKPVVKYTIDGEVPLSAGEIQAGGIYEVIYSAAISGATGGWLILNPTPQQVIIPGLMLPYGSDVVPSGWLECNGAAVSRTTYAALFSVINTKWGAGDSSTTFNVPDLRGEFLRGWDHGRGIDTGRTFGSAQADEIESHTHTATGDTTHNHTGRGVNPGPGPDTGGVSGTFSGPATTNLPASVPLPTINATGGTETRPRNLAAMFIIKT